MHRVSLAFLLLVVGTCHFPRLRHPFHTRPPNMSCTFFKRLGTFEEEVKSCFRAHRDCSACIDAHMVMRSSHANEESVGIDRTSCSISSRLLKSSGRSFCVEKRLLGVGTQVVTRSWRNWITVDSSTSSRNVALHSAFFPHRDLSQLLIFRHVFALERVT